MPNDTDLFLDASGVEKRAAAEQSGDADAAVSPSRVPASFKAVPIPLPGGIDHAVAGVATRNSGQGVIRRRGVPQGSTLVQAWVVWAVVFGPDCARALVSHKKARKVQNAFCAFCDLRFDQSVVAVVAFVDHS